MLNVRFVGPVRRPGAAREIEVDPRDLQTVGDLLEYLGYGADECGALHVLVDGTRRQLDAPIADANSIEILVAIGGG